MKEKNKFLTFSTFEGGGVGSGPRLRNFSTFFFFWMNPSLNHYLSCLKRGLLAQVAWVIAWALWGLFLDWTSNVIGYSWPRVDKVKARLTRARSCQIGDQVGQATDQVHHGLTIRLKVFFWITKGRSHSKKKKKCELSHFWSRPPPKKSVKLNKIFFSHTLTETYFGKRNLFFHLKT